MKVAKNGLRIDPYAIPSHQWQREPDVIPEVKWSDMFTYLVCTPSPYTQEELKVFMFFYRRHLRLGHHQCDVHIALRVNRPKVYHATVCGL